MLPENCSPWLFKFMYEIDKNSSAVKYGSGMHLATYFFRTGRIGATRGSERMFFAFSAYFRRYFSSTSRVR